MSAERSEKSDTPRRRYALLPNGRLKELAEKDQLPREATYWCYEGDKEWTRIDQDLKSCPIPPSSGE